MRSLFILLIIALIFSCGSNEDDEISAEISQAIENDQYKPPEDDLLTKEQIENYIRIRIQQQKQLEEDFNTSYQSSSHADSREKEELNTSIQDYIDAFRSLSENGNHLPTYLRSAKQLGFNTKEYAWVKNKIFATLRAYLADSSSVEAITIYENKLNELKSQSDATDVPHERHLIDQQIRIVTESMKYVRNQHNELSETERKNLRLLETYIPQIMEMRSEINELHRKMEMVDHE
ncbi:hypothetical protein GF337_14665 [candidate division KSB1 bacterium]|nr:hypothetical protein [candidate division KSB1 bacterium]